MNQAIILRILVAVVAVFSLLFLAALYIGRKSTKSNPKSSDTRASKTNMKLYYRLVKWPFIRGYILKIRRYIEMIDLSDQRTIEKKTVSMSLVTISASVLLWLVLVLLDQSIQFLAIGFVVVMMIHHQLIHLLVDRLEDKLLKQFVGFLSEVRHHYNEHQMIDEAIYDAIQTADYEMARHGTRMYEVLASEEGDMDIESYYETAPNQYFKSFVALSYTVLKFGDQKISGTSNFLKNLNFLKQEISMALLKRDKLNYLLSSLTLISVLPIFLVKPLEHWASKSMPELMNYYQGVYGFVAQIALFLMVILAYQLIIRIRSRDEGFREQEKSFSNLLINYSFFRELIGSYVKGHYSKAKKLDRTLKMTGEKVSVEQFYSKQIFYGILIFTLTLVVILNIHYLTRTTILSPPFISDEASMERTKEIETFDESYVKSYDSNDEALIKEQLILDLGTNDTVIIEENSTRIMKKIMVYEKAVFSWWQFIICMVIGVMGSKMPSVLLAFKKSVMLMHMEDEILQFHTIILMLMHIKRMSVCDLLEWMSLFAVIFKEDIEQCLNDMELGDIEALEALKIRAIYPPFVKIVENLQATADKITIEEAFDELLVERGFYQEKRKQDTEILINKKGSWGKLIAFVPMSSTILLFLLVPFTHLGISQFSHYVTELSHSL
ncbi:MAG: hypothetical protein PF505_02875 [Vallitaleaceae bacterium]|jgi:Flp pilus assembly protein TadB|nr:hypothetical protein [Vallitaleaceae bacterium]